MNTAELTVLLARIQIINNKQVDELTIQAWEPLLDDVDYEDAVNAVNEHFRTSKDYLEPVDIRRGADVFRRRRIDAEKPKRPIGLCGHTLITDVYCERGCSPAFVTAAVSG